MLAVGMIFGSPLLSYVSSHIVRGRKPVLVFSSAFLLIFTAMLAFYTEKMSQPVLYLLCLGLGVFSSAVVVIGFTIAKELFPVRIAGTATGLVNLFPFAGGAVFQPILGYALGKVRAGKRGIYLGRLSAGFPDFILLWRWRHDIEPVCQGNVYPAEAPEILLIEGVFASLFSMD